MGRKKIAIKRITDERVRKVTFSKRKGGLVKKAMELSLLCDCEIGLVIFTPKPDQKLYKYATNSMENVVNRYHSTSQAQESVHNGLYEALYEKKGAKATDLDQGHDQMGHVGMPGVPPQVGGLGALGALGMNSAPLMGPGGLQLPFNTNPNNLPGDPNKKSLSVMIPGADTMAPPVLSGGPDSLLGGGEAGMFKTLVGSPTDVLPSPGTFFSGAKEKTPLGNTPSALSSFSWSNPEAKDDMDAK